MVWTGGGGQRLAKSLITLINQMDAQFPIRDRSSDGTIGDVRHQHEVSDHNPDHEGVVRALDITHDPAHGVDTYKLADNLRIGRDPRIKYLISNRRICGNEGYASRNGVPAWTWTAYHGTNPHNMHVHVSVSNDDALADDTRPWIIGDTGSPAHPRLKLGDSGDAVKEAQQHLGIAVTGSFDAQTEEAVRAFQARSSLAVDGLIGPYTWQALLSDHVPDPTGQSSELSADTINAIVRLAASSPIAHYHWHERGTAPIGYIKGMAVTFALVCQKWKAGDSAAHLMAAANTHNDDADALSWYNSNFHNLGMSNDVAGLNTLRHLFVLMLGLGMRESSGNCFEGRDTSSHTPPTSENAEAGLFQQSHDSFHASPELAKLMKAYQDNPTWGFQRIFREGVPGGPSPNVGSGAGADFQRLCKVSPAFAVEAAAVGLRTISGHHGQWGPINRKEAELKSEADTLFEQVQQIVEAAPVPGPQPVPVPAPVPGPQPIPIPAPVPVPVPIPQPAPAPTPQPTPVPPPPAPVPSPLPMDRVEAALMQLITLFREFLTSIRQPVPGSAAPSAGTAVQPLAQPAQADTAGVIQQLMNAVQAMKGKSPATDGPLTPAQLQDQMSQLRDLLNTLSAGASKAGLPELGQVNGALGQTIGNLLNGKKTAIGVIGALLTSLLTQASSGTGPVADDLMRLASTIPGLSGYAMPIFLALSAWGVLGKMEKWTQNTAPPPSQK
jgi:hypothetical protein